MRLAQFDVVVRDSSGKLVSGLGPEDFAVLEDGRPLEVVGVDPWGFDRAPAAPSSDRPPGAAAPAPPSPAQREKRSFVILFDAMSGTSALRFTQAKRAAMGFVRNRLGEDDTAVVYSLDLALRAQSGFTSDREELARSIERIPWMPGSTLADDIAESVMAYRSRAGYKMMEPRLEQQSQLEAERLDWTREHFYRGLQDLQDVFRALPGKRVLVVASAGFPMTAAGRYQRELGGFTPEFKELVRLLQRTGVVVYTIDIGDDLAFSDVSKTIDWRIAAGKLGMEETVLDDLGLDTGMGAGSAIQRRQVLGVLAAETGGRMLTQSDFEKAFAAVDEESGNFYRISCNVPERAGDVKYRRVEIRAKRPGLRVQSRRGRYGDIVPAAQRPAAAETAATSLDRYDPLGVRAGTASLPEAVDGRIPVAVVAEVLGPVRFPTDAEGNGTLDLDFFAVARVGDEVVGRYSKRFAARVRSEGAGALRDAFRLEGRMSLPPGLYDLQTSVRIENPPQFGSWTGSLAVQPQGGSSPRISAAWLAADGPRASPLVSRAELPEGAADPLAMAPGVRVLPAVAFGWKRGDPLLAVLWLKDLVPGDGGAPPRLKIDVAATSADGAEAVPTGKLLLFEPDGPGRWRALIEVDTGTLEPGPWRLRISARDLGAEAPASSVRLPFSVEATSSAP